MALPTYKAKQRGEISIDGQYEWTGYNWIPVSSFGSGGVNADTSRAVSQSSVGFQNTGANSFYNTNSGLPYIGDLGLGDLSGLKLNGDDCNFSLNQLSWLTY